MQKTEKIIFQAGQRRIALHKWLIYLLPQTVLLHDSSIGLLSEALEMSMERFCTKE